MTKSDEAMVILLIVLCIAGWGFQALIRAICRFEFRRMMRWYVISGTVQPRDRQGRFIRR